MTHAAPATVLTAAPGESERHLIARAREGDRAAARSLYDAHARRVHRLIFRLCGDEDLARDLTQDTFVRVFRKLDTFRGDSAFGTWVHRIAVSVALNGMRREKRHRILGQGLDDVAEPAVFQGPGDPELRARLEAAINALPEGGRLVIIMHDIEGYTHAQIATLLGIAEGTSKTRLFDARARLRKTLADVAPEKDR
jgi:RNA polymerase sigma-70 factor (ECF subfamily)